MRRSRPRFRTRGGASVEVEEEEEEVEDCSAGRRHSGQVGDRVRHALRHPSQYECPFLCACVFWGGVGGWGQTWRVVCDGDRFENTQVCTSVQAITGRSSTAWQMVQIKESSTGDSTKSSKMPIGGS